MIIDNVLKTTLNKFNMKKKFMHHNFHKQKFKHKDYFSNPAFSHHKKSPKSNIKNIFYGTKHFIRKNSIFCSIISIVFAVVLGRLAFINTFFGKSMSELRYWLVFFAILFFIIGIVSIKVWIKNHVSDFNLNFTNKRR